MDPGPEKLAARLATALSAQLGGEARIMNLVRLSGGASRETWAFDAIGGDGARVPLILRQDFEGGRSLGLAALSDEPDDYDRAGEFALCRALYEAGLPVPRPVCLPDPATGLRDCFVMERIEGEGLPRKLLRDEAYAGARPGMAAALGSVAARIHGVDPGKLPPLPVRDVGSQLSLCRRMLDLAGAPRPVFELALRWLRDRAPRARSEPRLVHGDYRNGNFLVGPEGLRAVLDWEYAHLGDPMEDLGFLCMRPWRFGNDRLEAGGFGPREAFLEAYEATSGVAVDPEAVRYWEILGTLKWGALCTIRAMLHLNRIQRSVEAAAIGRRVAETEYDLVHLLE